MKVLENGVYRDATAEEIEHIKSLSMTYEERVVSRIRERYSVDDELAILRQRDTKPDEFAEYNRYVEQSKAEEKESEQV